MAFATVWLCLFGFLYIDRVCFVSWRWPRPKPSSVKQALKGDSEETPSGFFRPRSIKITEYSDDFYSLARADAEIKGVEVDEFLKAIQLSAREFMNGDTLVDRATFVDSLVSAIEDKGALTLVLGGKNVGKSFALKKAMAKAQENNKVYLLFADMRDSPATTLQQAIRTSAMRQLSPIPFVGQLLGAFASAKILLDFPTAAGTATPLSNAVAGILEALENLLPDFLFSKNRLLDNRLVAVVVDEANLGLPRQGQEKEGQRALAKLVAETKQRRRISAVLVSSEFGYPFRLQDNNINLDDIQQVILVPEIPEDDMKMMLIRDWGMGEGLAGAFCKYFGGHIYTASLAVDNLVKQKSRFDPFRVGAPLSLEKCLRDSEALVYLESMAKKGYAVVTDPNVDKAARCIAEAGIGGVLSYQVNNFGLPPEFWQEQNCKFALVPASFFRQLQLCYELSKRAGAKAASRPNSPP